MMERSEAAADESLAAILARIRLGIAIAAMIRMIATTISSSISEKPLLLFTHLVFPSLKTQFFELMLVIVMTQSGLMFAPAGPNRVINLGSSRASSKTFVYMMITNFSSILNLLTE